MFVYTLLANGNSFHDVHALMRAVSRSFGEFFSEGYFSLRQILFEMDPRVHWPCVTAKDL